MSGEDLESRLEALQRLLGRSVSLREPPLDKPYNTNEDDEEPNIVNPTGRSLGQGTSNHHDSTKEPRPIQTTQPPIDLAEKVLDYSTFRANDVIDADVAFCPWNLVIAYPSRYIGKTNKPRAQPFFDKILEGRVWDFFYVHDVSRPLDKPALLVPTVQFEDFLRFVNQELAISLCIPGSVHLSKFFLKFGNGDTPRPRYLQRSRDSKTLKIDNWPLMSEEDAMAFKVAPARFQMEWTNIFKRIPTSITFGKGTNSRRKAIQKSEHRASMLKEAQHLLGVGEQGITEDAVFISIDVEALERAPNPISEVGIAILDIDAVKDISPGLYGEPWWPMIQAYHLRTKEYSGLVNREFVQGCPDAFDFGVSTFPQKADVPGAIMAILAPLIETNRPLIIVGHDVKQDIQFLSEIGVEITKLAGIRSIIDSQALHQAWRASDSARSLLAVLGDLGMASKHLHNAGNDAVYTLRAMIGVATRQYREQVVKEPDV